VWYGTRQALRALDLDIWPHTVTAFIGPSGCGKSTFLRCFNRMNDAIEGTRTEGTIALAGVDIRGPEVDVINRAAGGHGIPEIQSVPRSIYDNVVYDSIARLTRRRPRGRRRRSLRAAALWDEVKDRLHSDALALAGGQQQRLCIARALAVRPEILLMDEPASSLDPTATARIEELLVELRRHHTLVIVTHNMQQAARISDATAFFYLGELVEYGSTAAFSHPSKTDRPTSPALRLTPPPPASRPGRN
jgi:phosphate transport system ATP-binding protein